MVRNEAVLRKGAAVIEAALHARNLAIHPLCRGLATHAVSAEPVVAAYGTKVTFREGQPLKCPNFELVYAGKRKVIPPQYPRGWWAYDFQARSGKEEKTVRWSAGTGDIGPTRFTVGGAAYDLELSRSDKLGKLKEDEVVVTKVR